MAFDDGCRRKRAGCCRSVTDCTDAEGRGQHGQGTD